MVYHGLNHELSFQVFWRKVYIRKIKNSESLVKFEDLETNKNHTVWTSKRIPLLTKLNPASDQIILNGNLSTFDLQFKGHIIRIWAQKD